MELAIERRQRAANLHKASFDLQSLPQVRIPYRLWRTPALDFVVSGGLTYRASRSTVLVQHSGETVWREYALTSNVLVSPGDLIRVPERYF